MVSMISCLKTLAYKINQIQPQRFTRIRNLFSSPSSKREPSSNPPPTSKPHTTAVKEVCLVGGTGCEGGYLKVFRVDISSNPRNQNNVQEISSFVEANWYNFDPIIVYSGNILYFLGGTIPKYINDFHMLDISNPFKKGVQVFSSAMHGSRTRAHPHATVTLKNGRIYVFGGEYRNEQQRCWSEYYDPNTKLWVPLCKKSINSSPDEEMYATVMGNDGRIMVWTEACDEEGLKRDDNKGSLFIHDISTGTNVVKTKKKTSLDPPMLDIMFGRNPYVKVGDTMYWLDSEGYSRLIINAYDYRLKKSYSGYIKGFTYDGARPEHLIYLGGRGSEFCFLMVDELRPQDTILPTTIISCIKFQVLELADSRCVDARVMSLQSFTVDGEFKLDAAFPV